MPFRPQRLKLLKQRPHIPQAGAVCCVLGRWEQVAIYSKGRTEDKPMKSFHLSLPWRISGFLGFTYRSVGDSVADELKKNTHRKDNESRKLYPYCSQPHFPLNSVLPAVVAAFLRSLVDLGVSWISWALYVSSALQVLWALLLVSKTIIWNRGREL